MNRASAKPAPAHNYFSALGADYIARGFWIIPIVPGGKRPLGNEWQSQRIDLPEHARRARGDAADAGLGVLTGVPLSTDPTVAVYLADVDSRNAGVANAMREWFGNYAVTPERIGEAPKFGAVFKAPADLRKLMSRTFYDRDHVGDRAHAHRLEWLGRGQQFVAHGVHPVTGKPYEHDGILGTLETVRSHELPEINQAQMQDAIAEFERLCEAAGLVEDGPTRLPTAAAATAAGPSDLVWLSKPDIPLAQVKEALDVLADLVDDYDQWIKIGMACHYQGHGAQDEGDWLDLWDRWSAKGVSYRGRSEIVEKWKGFAASKSDSRPTTAATILAMAKDARARMKYSAVDQYKQLIEAADSEHALRDGVCTQIARDATIEAIDRDLLVERVQMRLKELTGNKPQVGLVRGLLRPAVAARKRRAAEWASPWVWVTEEDTFFNTQTKERYSKKTFDAVYNRCLEGMTEGGKPIKARASEIVLDKWDLPVVSGVRYVPAAGTLFTMDGRSYANSYRTDLIPAVPVVNSAEDDRAIAAMQRHLELLVPAEAYRTVLVQALAWMATHPGEKMHWAPLIKGIEGDGKTLLARLLAHVMGHANVRVLSPGTLSESSFTGWIEGNCVIAIEELMIKGPRRHDVMNKLKPIITNDYIEVHPKGRDPYTAPNTSNVIAMTNHEDALPLADTDRRWFVLFSSWKDILEMEAALAEKYGLTIEDHWSELWNGVENHSGALRGWLESIDLTTFKPYGRAPATHFKTAMIAVETSDVDLAVRDILEEGEFGKGMDGIALGSMVSGEVDNRISEPVHSRRLNRAMAHAGFHLHPASTIKYSGRSYRLYVTERWAHASIAQISDHLRATANEVPFYPPF
jgi:hypothetical protein